MTSSPDLSPSVLIVDDDPTACAILGKTLEKGGFTYETLHDGTSALRRMAAPRAPRIVLLDWMMPDLSGLEVCRKLRNNIDGMNPYVFLVSGRQSDADALQGFDAGVDEFIAKPFDPQLLLARIQSAQRRLEAQEPRGRQGFFDVLHRASEGLTGEVILRGKNRTGRVIFHKGKIAWVHVSGGLPLMPLLLRLGLTEADVRQLLQECQSKRLPFLDTLADWGLVSQVKLKDYFREELGSRLALLSTTEALSCFFVPEQATLQSRLAYGLEELLPSASEDPPSSISLDLPLPRIPPAGLQELLQQVLALDGVRSAGLIDQESGQLTRRGDVPCNESLLRKMTRLFRAEDEMAIEESMLVNASSYHLIRSLPEGWLLYASIDRQTNPNLALIRLKMNLS